MEKQYRIYKSVPCSKEEYKKHLEYLVDIYERDLLKEKTKHLKKLDNLRNKIENLKKELYSIPNE